MRSKNWGEVVNSMENLVTYGEQAKNGCLHLGISDWKCSLFRIWNVTIFPHKRRDGVHMDCFQHSCVSSPALTVWGLLQKQAQNFSECNVHQGLFVLAPWNFFSRFFFLDFFCLLGCKINSPPPKEKKLWKAADKYLGIKSKDPVRWNDEDEEGIFGLSLGERIAFPTQYNIAPLLAYNLVAWVLHGGKPTVFWGSNRLRKQESKK